MITVDNFYTNTTVVFLQCQRPKRESDYISRKRKFVRTNGKSDIVATDEVSSVYWFGTDQGGDFVIRESTHWGSVASCFWKIRLKRSYVGVKKCGKAYFKDFKKR